MTKKKNSNSTNQLYNCRECEKVLKNVTIAGGDLFSIFSDTLNTAMHCENKKCSRYGDLTIGGIPQ